MIPLAMSERDNVSATIKIVLKRVASGLIDNVLDNKLTSKFSFLLHSTKVLHPVLKKI